jgi:acyl-coenzyme A thioesterase PaaI-like protein
VKYACALSACQRLVRHRHLLLSWGECACVPASPAEYAGHAVLHGGCSTKMAGSAAAAAAVAAAVVVG